MLPYKFLLAAAVLLVSAPAMGQGLYQDIQREFSDENQLQRDVRQYQYDISTGHYLRAAADRARIQNDESNIRYDQALVQNDLAYQGGMYQGQSLIPHPQYAGYYYYPSQPAQLYYYQTAQPAQAQVPAPATYVGTSAQPTYVGPPRTGGPANVPPVGVAPSAVASAYPTSFNAAPPMKTITVLINNPAETGVPINFTVDGTSYAVPSGYTQKLTGTSSSIVEFDRGDLFGDGRYTLSDGSFEFRYATDKGWELYKKPVKPPVALNATTGTLPRNVPPRSIASTANSTAPSPTTTSPTPGSSSDTVPSPPVPDPSTPR